MVADTTDGTRQLTGYASRGLGPGQAAVREAISGRQANMAQRVRGHIDQTLGSTANPHQQSQQLADTARRRAQPFYEQAYQMPVTVTPRLREFMDSPVGPNAIDAAANSIRQTPAQFRNVGSEQPFQPGTMFDPTLGPQGSYRSDPAVPVMEAWDGAKRYLDDMESQLGNRFVANPQGMTSDLRPIDLTRRQLLEELDAQVPPYAQARQEFAGPIQERQAFETGMQSLPGTARATPHDAQAQMSRMTPNQVDQFRLGDRTRLADEVYGGKNSVPRWGDATRPINGNDGRTDLIRTIHGDDAADNLTRRTDLEREAHLTYRETHGNSATQGRGAVDEGMDAQTGVQAAGQVAKGNLLSAAWTILTSTARGRVGRYAEGLKRELALMLAETRPANVDQAMQLVEQRLQRDAIFRARMAQAAVEIGKVSTIGLAGHSGDRTDMYDQGPIGPAEEPEYGPYDPRDPTLGKLPGDFE
jgi:hypothetical protein